MKLNNALAATDDERRSGRNDICVKGQLTVGQHVHPIDVLNVSAHGLMGEIDAKILPGRRCTVELPELASRAGNVAWMREGHFGIAFAEPLTLAELLALA